MIFLFLLLFVHCYRAHLCLSAFFEDRFNSFSEMVAESGVVAFKKSLRMMLAHSFATDCQSAPFLHTELSFDTVLLCCRPMALCRAAKLSYVVYLCSEASSRVSVYFWFLQNRKNSYLGAKGLRSSKKVLEPCGA